MKSLRRTIIVLITLNLITACYALAQPAPAPAPAVPAEKVQMEAARQQMELAKEQMEAAKSTGERAGQALSQIKKEFGELRFNFANPFSHGGAGAVMVIPTSEMKAEDIATITEDMTVMSRIIDRQLGKEDSRFIGRYGDFLWQSNQMTETMYLQGYGALFLRKADFPLSPTQQVQEEEKETKKEAADPVWEQTKQEIYEPPEGRRHKPEREEEKYDAQKVENLKTNIIEILKHAANIRNLKPDESVIVAVKGRGGSSTITNIAVSGTGHVLMQSKDNKSMSVVTPGLPIGTGSASPVVLIIRVKKSDIDSFSKGGMDINKFRKQVQIFTCPQLGGGAEGSVSIVTPGLPTSSAEPVESF